MTNNTIQVPENYQPKLHQIIQSPLDQDSYKFSMGQAIYHQFPSYTTTWTFKCIFLNLRINIFRDKTA